MAEANVVPIPDPHLGVAALDEDIPCVLNLMGRHSLEELGWIRLNALSLLVPLEGFHQGVRDQYLLRLGFQAYRKWPPSAQFVNPATYAYDITRDQDFVPRLTSPECHTHVAYRRTPESRMIQLICCSATLEFYEELHPVAPGHLWSETNTFYTTINAIQRALTSHYQGRFPANGQ